MLGALLIPAEQARAQADPAATQAQETGRDEGIPDILVTAERREQTLQESSIPIAVVEGDSLRSAGISQPSELQTVVAGLNVSQAGGTVNAYLRGVGSFSTDANAESAIAFNINGVYISRPAGIGPIFFDLERVEVLKGPQGTLYGRNATGGAINLIARRPEPELGASVDVDVGNYDLLRLTPVLNLPVATGLWMRAAAQITQREGYLSDGYDDQVSQAVRLSALWEPSPAISLNVAGEYSHQGGMGPSSVVRSAVRLKPRDPWTGPSEAASQPPSAQFGGTRLLTDGFMDTRVWAVSADLEIDLGGATVTFIPAWRDTRPRYRTYGGGFRFQTLETSDHKSVELRLANSANRLAWVLGAYFLHEDQTQDYDFDAVPFQKLAVQSALDTKTYAAFGEGELTLAEGLRAIAGLRYSRDRKTQAGVTQAILPRPGLTNNDGRRAFQDVSWRAGFEYDLSSASMLFATAATGYKAGGFFAGIPPPNNSFGPEQLTAYTLGSNNRLFANRVQVNVELFYWKYSDKQERFLGVTPDGILGLLTTNAGSATLYGAELNARFRPHRRGDLRLSGQYMKSRYDRFFYVAYAPPPFGLSFGYPREATGCQLGPVMPYTPNDPFVPNDASVTIDCAGKPLVRAPTWTGSASYSHVISLAGGHELVPAVSAMFSSRQFLTADFIRTASDNGYVTIDTSLTLRIARTALSIQAWVRNLNNAPILTGAYRYPFSAPAQVGGDPSLVYANIRPPRTIGISLRLSLD